MHIQDIAEVDTSLYSTGFVGTQEVAGQLRVSFVLQCVCVCVCVCLYE